MKKVINLMLVLTMTVSAWEINTHRAIERKAIEASKNLKKFVKNSGISSNTSFYSNERFEGYHENYLGGGDYTYLDYVENGELNGISTKEWQQKFPPGKPSYQKMIEAGSILEDAQWQHFLDGGKYNYYDMTDGRFVNHFYDAQNGGHALTYGAFLRTDALHWALGSRIYAGNYGGQSTYVTSPNIYTYSKALNYFLKGFTEANPNERRKYQAKMFVALGHLMHLMNDMTSPAHTRDDSHPLGDAMEVWGRGGEDGKQNMGYKIVGNTLDDDASIVANQATYMPKYSKFSDFITKEATWTATHFFSKDTIYTKPKPSISDTYESFVSSSNEIDKYYIRSYGNGTSSCRNGCVPRGTKLGIRIKSYIINALNERYYTDDASKIVLDKTTTFKGDYSVLKDDAKVLIPRTIANARNFLDYFFRAQIEAKIDKRADGYYITIKNISDKSLVKNVNDITFRNVTFYLKYDSGNGVWKNITYTDHGDINEVVVTFNGVYHSNNIAPSESISFPITGDENSLPLNKKIIILYDGLTGNERSLAVCDVQTPRAMMEY